MGKGFQKLSLPIIKPEISGSEPSGPAQPAGGKICRGLTAAPVSPPGVIHLGGTINRSRCLHLGRKQGARENQAEAYALKLGERIKKRETLIENALYRWNTAKKRA